MQLSGERAESRYVHSLRPHMKHCDDKCCCGKGKKGCITGFVRELDDEEKVLSLCAKELQNGSVLVVVRPLFEVKEGPYRVSLWEGVHVTFKGEELQEEGVWVAFLFGDRYEVVLPGRWEETRTAIKF